jgi:hypothetical protein
LIIIHLALTNGVEIRRAATFRRKKILGLRAPKWGLPVLNAKADATMAIVCPA